MAASTKPNVVSRFLSGEGFDRSKTHATRIKGFPTYTEGYKVFEDDGETRVYHVLGSTRRTVITERRIAFIDTALRDLTKTLEKQYTVVRKVRSEGANDYLVIPPKD